MMTSRLAFWRKQPSQDEAPPAADPPPAPEPLRPPSILRVDIQADDPVLAYFLRASEPVDMENLNIASPGAEALRQSGVRLAAPLVSQGELIGVINLGPRMSDQDYSSDDRKLLDDLAGQAAPAVRVAQLVYQQKIEAAERERIEHELRVARIIQQTLLPKSLPEIPGWGLSALWRPAREVSGDFYDFYSFPDGRLGIVIADVTDKGVPAALVMATTRTLLRAAAERLQSPGMALERANEALIPDMPPKMFVTCLYALLDPGSGVMRYANAGQNLPFRQHQGEALELRATGMPLGLLPGMSYEEKEVVLEPGDRIVFYSDGLVEAHNGEREMFGTPRLHDLLAGAGLESNIIDHLMGELVDFTGDGWEQEDDVTLVSLTCLPKDPKEEVWRSLGQVEISSQPGNERLAVERVMTMIDALDIAPARLAPIQTAVAEATMNAMEHGNRYDPAKPVTLQALRSETRLQVRISDYGEGDEIPPSTAPDIEAKLAGEQSPRGWGLFLIKSMVDDLNISAGDDHHTLELYFDLTGGQHEETGA